MGAISLSGVVRWLVEGLALFVPPRWRRAGWRPAFILWDRNNGDEMASALTIERTWSGAQRRTGRPVQTSELPIVIALADTEIFETAVTLPPAARGSLREAVGLQLDTLSPTAPEAVVFDVGTPTATAGGRLRAPVALAKREHIEELRREVNGAPLKSIGAAPSLDGALKYVFEKSRVGELRIIRTVFTVVSAIAVSFIVFAFGVSALFERRLAATEEYAEQLFEGMRLHREEIAFLSSMPTARPGGLGGNEIASLLESVAKSAPDGTIIERLSAANGDILIEGYSPDNSTWPQEWNTATTASDHPGLQRFRIQRNVEQ